MTYEQVLKAIESIKKGVFTKIHYKTIKKPYAQYKGTLIEKETTTICRLGIGYYNMENNVDKPRIKSTKGDFEPNLTNYLFKTIDKNGVEHYCLRVYTTNHKSQTTYYMNGKETTKEYLKENKVIPFYESKEPLDCYDIRIENIISIGAF